MNRLPIPQLLLCGATLALFFGFGLYLAWRFIRGLRYAPPTSEIDTDQAAGPDAFDRGTPRTSKCLALYHDAIRRTDGSYVRAFIGEPQQTMLAHDQTVMDRYRRLAGLIAADMPEGTILQSRFNIFPDNGRVLADHRATAPPLDIVHPPAVELHETQLQHYEDLTRRGRFKQTQLSLWARVPTTHSDDHLNNGLAAFFSHLKKALKVGGLRNVLAAFRDSYDVTNDRIVRRMIADEDEAFTEADRTFRLIEREGAVLNLKRLVGTELRAAIYMGHNESARSCPNISDDPLVDLRPYLCNETIKGDGWYLLHGNTPVAMISLFVPPEPETHAGIMRHLIGHPGLTCRHTIITEFVKLSRDKAKARLRRRMKRIIKSNVSARTGQVKLNEDQERAYLDLKKVKTELASPTKMLTRVKVTILVYGTEAHSKREEIESVRELELNCERILETVRDMPGADAAREEPVALRALYHDLLVGEMSTAPTEREIEEVATSTATLIPTETAWRGEERHAHTFVTSVHGSLVPLNFFQSEKFSPFGYALGHMGSGKTGFLGLIANGVLARVPHASVAGCDFNDGLGALVDYNDGRNLRFDFQGDRTINVWDYPGLEDGTMPDAEQIALVVAELMLLARREESDVIAETVIETCVRAVYENEVAYNEPGEEKHEPTHSHFLNKLRTYHFDNITLNDMAGLLHPILERYRANKFLDAPTHPDFARASRIDMYNVDSLDKFPPDIQRALSFRIGARLISSVGRKVNGQIQPLLLLFTEMHKIKEKYPSIFTALKKGARMGRTNNVVTLFDTHSYDDLSPIHDITANAGIKIIGKQSDGVDDLCDTLKLSEAAAAAINSIRNTAGSHAQYVIVLGSGIDAQVEKIQVEWSPHELWLLTTHPRERNARARVAQLKPHWSMQEIESFLASVYPRGLAFEGITEIDESLLPSYQEEVLTMAQYSYTDALLTEVERIKQEIEAYRLKYGEIDLPKIVPDRRTSPRGEDSQALN